MRTSWSGIHSVLVTPFRKDGSVDVDRYRTFVETNIANGADGVIVAGSTGEFYAMSLAERRILLSAAVEQSAGRVPVLAGVSDLLESNVLAMCEAAEATGCAGILALPPIYAMPSPRETHAFYRRLASATRLPIMLYNSPRRTGVDLLPEHVEALLELPSVVSIKDSSGNIVQVSQLVQRVGGELAVFVGYETMIRPALAVGAVGVVAMAHQLSGRLVRGYFDACREGDGDTIARLEPALFAIYRCFQSGSYYASIKATMNALGLEAGDPRPPLLPATPDQAAKIDGILAEAGVAAAIAGAKG
ncbi:MAG: dihydrodipicolinate synthase family protein [Rhizobiales bacterium]|nr:dihydrodipicolinate synthase family protein [Hyphomicrobiales bacterium]MBN9010459.1 dihydrodipicolinate synthase family protein [Hyphomicrobiales bacterium]